MVIVGQFNDRFFQLLEEWIVLRKYTHLLNGSIVVLPGKAFEIPKAVMIYFGLYTYINTYIHTLFNINNVGILWFLFLFYVTNTSQKRCKLLWKIAQLF